MRYKTKKNKKQKRERSLFVRGNNNNIRNNKSETKE